VFFVIYVRECVCDCLGVDLQRHVCLHVLSVLHVLTNVPRDQEHYGVNDARPIVLLMMMTTMTMTMMICPLTFILYRLV